MVKTDVVDEGARGGDGPAERWWMDWTTVEGDDELFEPTSLWEAEVAALDDEQLLALETSAEDD